MTNAAASDAGIGRAVFATRIQLSIQAAMMAFWFGAAPFFVLPYVYWYTMASDKEVDVVKVHLVSKYSDQDSRSKWEIRDKDGQYKVVDVHQHGSVAAGRAFEQAQAAGLNVSVLEQTKRFDRATEPTKEAVKAIKGRGYAEAISMLDRTEVENSKLATTVAERYLVNMQELKARGLESPVVAVVAVTNKDRKNSNAEIHNLLQANNLLGAFNHTKEHFDDPQLTKAQSRNAGMLSEAKVDRLVFNQDYKESGLHRGDVIIVERYDIAKNRIFGRVEGKVLPVSINPDKLSNFSPYVLDKREFSVGDKIEARAIIRGGEGKNAFVIKNGKRGVVTEINGQGSTVRWKDGQETFLPNKSMRFADLGYAHTTIKDQGATYNRMIIAASETGAKVFNRQATYVAATRAKDNTEIVTSDYERLLKSAGKEVKKTTSHEAGMEMSGGVGSRTQGIEKNQGIEKHQGAEKTQGHQTDSAGAKQEKEIKKDSSFEQAR